MTRLSLSRPAVTLFTGYAVNFFGSGMSMPFLFIYLQTIRHYSLTWASIVLSLSSLAGLVSGPVAGWLVDRLGASRVVILSLGVLAIGTAGYVVAVHLDIALAAAVLTGIGNAAMWSALSAMLARIAGPSRRGTYFGIAYAVQNLGLGLGAGAAGLMIRSNDPASFTTVFLLDAFTYIVFMPFIWSIRAAASHVDATEVVPSSVAMAEPASATVGPSAAAADLASATGVRFVPTQKSGYHQVLRDRGLIAVTALNVLFVIFAFGQLNVTFSAWTAGGSGAGTGITGIAFFANCIVIALVQVPVLHFVRSWRRTRLAAVAGLGFALCWGLVLVAGNHRGLWTSTWLIVALVVFGIGETFLSPSLSPLVNDLAPERLRGRYNATFALSWQLGTIAGPLIAGVLLPHGGGFTFGILTAACGLGALGALVMERLIPDAANRGDLAEV